MDPGVDCISSRDPVPPDGLCAPTCTVGFCHICNTLPCCINYLIQQHDFHAYGVDRMDDCSIFPALPVYRRRSGRKQKRK